MSKLNKIFYGPAGTGKTRRAIEEAVVIVNKGSGLNITEKNKDFKSFSKLSILPFDDKTLVQKIHNLEITIDAIVNDANHEGHLKKFTNGIFDKDKSKEAIKEYRAYPLIETVTFHPSYSYQDFVEGISVETTDRNQIIYKAKDGIFKKICDRANHNPDYNYVLIIDEINRGDISSIFGELFTLLEDSKRKGGKEEMSINLPYSKDDKGNPKRLTVPRNLHIVATMNTVDKSIALIDVALRRRFDFIECMPNYTLEEFNKYKEINLPKLLEAMNQRITILKNENYQIGHSYFLNIDSLEKLVEIMKKKYYSTASRVFL